MVNQPESPPIDANSHSTRVSILLVEDVPDNLVELRAALRDPAYHVVEVRSPDEALERLEHQEFAVILVEVGMPDLKGFDTARLILEHESSGQIPLIFCASTDLDPSQVEIGYALGAADFLAKPFSSVVVKAKIRSFATLVQRQKRASQDAEQLRMIVQGSTDYAIFMLDPQGRIATWNVGAERIKQYKADEIIGQHFSRFYPQDVIDRGWPEYELQVASAEGRFEDEGWRLRKDGTRFWANVVITALRDERGRLVGFSKVTRDLTERKAAEESLRRSEERLRHMVEGVKDYAIFMLDPSGHVASWNLGAERIKGYAADEIIGRHFSTFYPQEALDRGWPEHELKVAIAEGRFEDEGWRVRKDGTQFWANVVITAIKGDENRLLGFTKVTRDLTARKEAEANARRLAEESAAREVAFGERERLRVTLASIGDAVISTDAHGRIEFLNSVAEELVGWNSHEAAGQSLEDVFHIVNENTRQPVENPALRALREGNIVGLANHTILIAKDGTERPIDDSAAPIRDAAGNLIGSVLVFRDISERQRNEWELRQREEQLRAVVETTPACIKIVAADGTLVSMNSAGLGMVDAECPEDVQGGCVYGLIRPPYREVYRQFHERICRGESGVLEFEIEGLKGTRRHMETHAAPLRGPDGAFQQLAITYDITERKRLDAVLRESEEKLRLLANTIPQLAWMARPDGHIFWYNNRWYEYTGTTPEQMEGWGWQTVHDPETLPRVVEQWKQSLSSGEPFDMVFPLRGADGLFRPFLTRINPLKSEDGTVLYWFGTNTDVTELRQAREALADSEERLRLALDAGRMGVWDWNIRTGDLKWSDSLEPLHGLAPGTFGGTFEHFQSLIYPDDRNAVGAAIQQAVDSGSEFYVEFRNVWPNGGIHWIAGSGKVFPGDDGKPLRMIGVGLDVTHRRRAEHTARFLADASAALAVLVDFDSTLQKVASLAVPHFADWVSVDVLEESRNLRRVAVAHVDPSKVELAHDLHRRLPPDPSAPQGVWNILRTGNTEIVPEITDEMLAASTNDEELLEVIRQLGLKSYIGVPLSVRGNVLGVLTFIVAESGHVYDDTDLAVAKDLASRAAIAIENSQLYRELRDADQRKDEFLATLAHELRNPLAPIRNSLQILKMPRVDSELIEQTREMMERQVHHLMRLVDDLLDVSRVMRGKIELRRESVELAAIIARALETAKPLIEMQGHHLNISVPKGSLLLDADPVRLTQVVGNLLTNAAKYTDSGGQIGVLAERDGDEVLLKIRDTGIGIAPDMLAQVFELFVQADHASSKSQGGLGIGLTLVKNLVEMHGGSVSVFSAGLGKGSEFTVRLPLMSPRPVSPNVRPASSSVSPISGHRLLVVDDNRDAAISLSMLLRLQGHEVEIAHDGPTALAVAAAFRPNVIFLDIGMPGMDGYEVARRVRMTPGIETTFLAAVTGWGQQEDRRRTAEAGFNHHLVKPPDPKLIEKLLHDLKPAKPTHS